eukprot:1491755-Amphidinium_carterae.1
MFLGQHSDRRPSCVITAIMCDNTTMRSVRNSYLVQGTKATNEHSGSRPGKEQLGMAGYSSHVAGAFLVTLCKRCAASAATQRQNAAVIRKGLWACLSMVNAFE